MLKIAVHQDLCTRCGACVALCTGKVLRDVDELVEAVAPEEC